MSTAALTSGYELTREGSTQLRSVLDGPSAPVSSRGFVSRRETDPEKLREQLASFEGRARRSARR